MGTLANLVTGVVLAVTAVPRLAPAEGLPAPPDDFVVTFALDPDSKEGAAGLLAGFAAIAWGSWSERPKVTLLPVTQPAASGSARAPTFQLSVSPAEVGARF